MPTYRIQHITSYEYDRPVTESVNEIRVFPYACPDQEVLQHDLVITGQPDIQYYLDYWGNRCGVFNLVPPHTELIIESKLLVRTLASSWPAMQNNSGFEQLAQETSNSLGLLELTKADAIKNSEVIQEFVKQINQPWKGVAATIQDCSQYIFSHFKYIKGITNVESTVDEILEHRAGVCQDFAHVLLQMLRSLQIPCRYVSGYICPNKTGLRGEGATHAWVESYIPGTGWAGIDPTNNMWVTNHHVKLAVGRNFSDCSPVKGSFKGPATQKLFVYVAIDYENGQHFEERNVVGSPVSGEERYLFPAADAGGMQQ
ncbi:MAG TPA: transglutaminase family protein [Flavihumibacter sp.]|nr:transglutaminase family protein [Bacteroidota bacterium]HPZ87963.1 transglutaminase family protein [Flavihumibacter sp.]HQD09631.1 transglutaminase family protein [Flavihumibacter sp.]